MMIFTLKLRCNLKDKWAFNAPILGYMPACLSLVLSRLSRASGDLFPYVGFFTKIIKTQNRLKIKGKGYSKLHRLDDF
jgi:hypothetical protein